MSLNPSFVYVTKALLFGSGVIAADTLESVADSSTRQAFVASGAGDAVDTLGTVDIAAAGYAKTAGVVVNLTGSTPITINLSSLAAATGVQVAGASSFAKWNGIIFQNVGSTALVVSPSSSDALSTPLGGTSPTYTLNAGDDAYWNSSSGTSVSSTTGDITITPTSGGTLFIGIGGS